ncbi:arginine decarboxylase SpeA [Thermoclostridium stercorarium subsp. stercorarium DSM 8532]|uniref:Arginine decarboxylase SpeA n=3 Tax=Thermoclostridium stercorarium TaxID=1510 RepID=L7VKW5_THES1|nr:aminotransferase class I/II-fold pyridoxal phosphate-dependent enzyme [Thermoclostridium stercorarium]AGC68780.1 arginine decarboxylase SpeA [Thermoclostridium stercorarium subsp. stercorarium DSM 8532]AGI39785.1 arginine decarboxylase [Thermoclostridium stercorarium subsp. stercorarium DSM 8532]ANW99099.1 arginine decarboxylase [Thermoclostridium stercorarium subsp. thermolacticum DSM 2910]ANX01635.1 arginine decarboxylase [Thermoclostridium stercorarium subsp. leptospartum DSM 9219]UZQ847
MDQRSAPIYEALERLRAERIVHFDVPGHKGGRGNKELTEFLGEKCLKADVNSMKPLDNLNHPVSVIKDAQLLAAEAFGAHSCFFIVNGTTAAVQAMVMSACKAGEKILMPRNVHISAINALILSGAVPVYIDPGIDKRLGIALGMSVDDVKRGIEENPDAKAILVNNPTYYGICSNLKEIVQLAHNHNMLVLVDEAHGTHFYFGENMPVSAMRAGADMASVSMHKTGGSLTQSSLLLCGENVNSNYVRQIIGLTQTTSASYLLLTSLDLARKNLSLNGKEIINRTVELAEYARKEINSLGGYYAFSRELVNNDNIYDFDVTKLSVNTRDTGLTGIEVYDILRDEYGIQVEFGDLCNILAIVSAGDRAMEIERLISALYEIKRLYSREPAGMLDYNYINPHVVYTPQKAFYSSKKMMPLKCSKGEVSGEFVMAYPPGIPILAPGERITEEIIDYIFYAKDKGSLLMGTQDMKLENILVVEG